MKKLLTIACLMSFGLTSNSQIWTEPVVINPWQSQLYSDYPDFCIDNEGNIHCVWSTKHGTNFYRIWYSKSENDGETWSPPYNVSQNNSKWMNEPHIVSDSQGKLHLTYDDIGSESNIRIIYKFYDGVNWSSSDTLSQGFAMRNLLAIDHNDRLYCFWYIPMAFSGNTFYRIHDSIQNTWSEIKKAYDSLFLRKVVDSFNNLKIIGLRAKIGYSVYTVGYGEYNNGNWNDIIEISPETYINSLDIDIDQTNEPNIIWQQNTPPNILNYIVYAYKNNNIWSNYDTITSLSDFIAITIDGNNDPNILLTKAEGTNNYLIHFKKSNGVWLSDTVDSGMFYRTKLLNKNNSIYLVQGITDSVINASLYTRILFRKINVIATSNKNEIDQTGNLKIFPNPTFQNINFDISILQSQLLKASIFDMQGVEIKILFYGMAKSPEIILKWDGTSQNGVRVGKGIYLFSLRTESGTIIKKIIMK